MAYHSSKFNLKREKKLIFFLIFGSIFFLHLLLLFYLPVKHSTRTFPIALPCHVKTVFLQDEKKDFPKIQKPSTKVKKPDLPKKKEATSTKTQNKTTTHQNEEKLLKKMQSDFAQLKKLSKQSPSSSLSLPDFPQSSLKDLAKQNPSNFSSPFYHHYLVAFLRNSLKLPESGKISVKLTLQKTGKFKALDIEKSESKKNEQYLEKILPTLHYPPFDRDLSTAQEHTFSLIVCNDD